MSVVSERSPKIRTLLRSIALGLSGSAGMFFVIMGAQWLGGKIEVALVAAIFAFILIFYGNTLIWRARAEAKDALLKLAVEVSRRDVVKPRPPSAKRETVGHLAAGVAHEFNNILQAVQGYVNFAREEIGGDHPVNIFLEKALKPIARGSAITNQLLLYSFLPRLVPKDCDLNNLVKNCEKTLAGLLQDRAVISLVVESTPLPVSIDQGSFQQILFNLCLNACDAMVDGGTIEISLSQEQIVNAKMCQGGALEPAEYGVISVKDGGTGIQSGLLEKIFEPFFTTKEVGNGSGLGLSSALEIVKYHGGMIDVESTVGKGSTFRVYVPFRNAVSTSGKSQVAVGTVLIAESDKATRAIAAAVLGSNGFTLIEAEDGIEVLNLFKQYGSDITIAVLNLSLPRKSGFDAWKEIASISPNCLFLFTYELGRLSQSQLEEIKLSGAKTLVKPYSDEQLVSFVKAMAVRPKSFEGPRALSA